MDSFTQIVLGAAVGEATLGNKVGNRAMIWGGLGGFLPDLDVASRFFMNEMDALATHRGISHSLVFAALIAFPLGYLVQQLYQSGVYQRRSFKRGAALLILGLIGFTVNFLPYMVMEKLNLTLVTGTLVSIGLIMLLLQKTYFSVEQDVVETTWRDWYWLFFWSVITHPLLDCFTAYGTQIFLPFSDYRVAFNIISVVDPIYTIPFILFLITAAISRRGSKRRKVVNWLGIAVSCGYLLFCYFHKTKINQVFEDSLAAEGVTYKRYMTGPVIFNNVLWLGVAESDSAFYHGMYSFYDKERRFVHLNTFPKNYHLIEKYQGDPTLEMLKWFSNDYYTILERDDGHLQLNDVRFGIYGGRLTKNSDYVFKFILKNENGKLRGEQSREGRTISRQTFADLWKRINGELEGNYAR